MVSITADEDVFIRYLQQWQASGRNLVTLPVLTKEKLELKLSVVTIDNTKQVSLNKAFYSYEGILGYYGRLLDQINDE